MTPAGERLPGAATVAAVNAMTAAWAREAVGERGTVLTAAGVWPLLALLAGPAHGRVRQELSAALGTDAADAAGQGRELLGALGRMAGVEAAIGLWTRRELPVRQSWRDGLPLDVQGELTGDAAADLAAMSRWAARHTGGLIERMPPVVAGDTLLVLANALRVATTWRAPFTELMVSVQRGPWAGRKLTGLRRTGALDDTLAVVRTPSGPLTVLRVEGGNGIDVRLLLGGEAMAGGEVLARGVAALDGSYATVRGAELPYGERDTAGPGLTVAEARSHHREARLDVRTAAFTVEGEHDLLAHARLFGLRSARRAAPDHFPGISDVPLAVSAARQSAVASFGARGFEAAAVTALGTRYGGVPVEAPYRSKRVCADFDRPFGFLAVHRASRLVTAAGWITDPDGFGRFSP